MKQLRIVRGITLPPTAQSDTVYELSPNPERPSNFYLERTDRNIGWLAEEEQHLLKNWVIGIAGCGGMGGLIAERLLRIGIGTLRIADCENFDISNINRQFGAMETTEGKNKAMETGRFLRTIASDTSLTVYPQGITEETVDHFVSGCHLICDEIEFWELPACIMLHQRARKEGIPIINAVTVGWHTFLFLFLPDSPKVEDLLGFTYEEACAMRERIRSEAGDPEAKKMFMDSVLRVFVPHIPHYSMCSYDDSGAFTTRLEKNGQVSIVGSNPGVAGCITANEILFYLLERYSSIKRNIIPTPCAPGYFFFNQPGRVSGVVSST